MEPRMKTLDLSKAVPDAVRLLRDRGEPASITAVLGTLGVSMAPTLAQGNSGEPGHSLEGEPVSLGRFQLLSEMGRGGMGRVLEAKDPEIRRSVAVKLVIDPSAVSEAQLARFVAEAQITGQLQHPNIVPVHEMGLSEGGQLYFVMKKVEGRSMRQVLVALRKGDEATTAEWTRTKLLHAFIQVCNAVAYAHDRGVLHRDLKPANIMLGPFGEVLLMDWGVARLMGDATEVVDREPIERVTVAKTLDGAAIGTPGYMSPEQAQGNLHQLDGRSDLWSLGTILYELLTLKSAYEASNVYALMFAAMSGPPEAPQTRAPGRNIPREISEVCLRAMASERQDRFATASELAGEVEAFLEGSKRREAARLHVEEAKAAWLRYQALATEREGLLAREKALDLELDCWAPLEVKAELLAVGERLGELGRDRVDRFERVSSPANRPSPRTRTARRHEPCWPTCTTPGSKRPRPFGTRTTRTTTSSGFAATTTSAATRRG